MVQSCPRQNLLTLWLNLLWFDFWPTFSIMGSEQACGEPLITILSANPCYGNHSIFSASFTTVYSPTESETPKYTEIRLLSNCRLFAGHVRSCSVFPAFNMAHLRRNSAENLISYERAVRCKAKAKWTLRREKNKLNLTMTKLIDPTKCCQSERWSHKTLTFLSAETTQRILTTFY